MPNCVPISPPSSYILAGAELSESGPVTTIWARLFPGAAKEIPMNKIVAAALMGALLVAAPAAFAEPARDELIRTEAQVGALNTADASSAAPVNFQEAQLRLNEARTAEDKNKDKESLKRSAEASLQADIVQEKIKLQALERTVSEIETGIATLRRELNS
jgi:hypothetical protein